MGEWNDERGTNLVDGSRPYYRCYETSDGKYMAVGAIEPEFFDRMLAGVGADPAQWNQSDSAAWPRLTTELEARFASKTRGQWIELFADVDACVTPVLTLSEAPLDPHNVDRAVFHPQGGGAFQPSAAPRFQHSVPAPSAAPTFGQHTREILRDLGLGEQVVETLYADHVVA
jgi:alpha-methylacyl-CoA racemase